MGLQDFTLTNATGIDIYHVYVSAADDDAWGEDVMGRDVLSDGEEVEIEFAGNEDQELWDIKIDDSDGNEIFWRGFNLAAVAQITLYWDGNKATAVTA
ncbi:MAG: hypothetical protein JWM10_2925 [Myxococcaceae bacterium]|nr:hypothetical protein [Myxococcaceae bacterium]